MLTLREKAEVVNVFEIENLWMCKQAARYGVGKSHATQLTKNKTFDRNGMENGFKFFSTLDNIG